MNVAVKYTYQDLRSMPDGLQRHELFEGDLVMTPSPGRLHQNAHGYLYGKLWNHVTTRSLGKLFSAPLDVYFDEETVVQPDIMFIAKNRLDILDEDKVNGAPDVVIEILSASTEARDRGFKYKLYAKAGVKEYWIVDPAGKTIEIYQSAPEGFSLLKKFAGSDQVRSSVFGEVGFSAREVWM